jgi:hypothetical protein
VLDVERRRVNKVRMTRRLVDEPAHETVQ